MGGIRPEAEQFVAARWPELRRLALLVTDADTAAGLAGRDHAAAVLADAVRNWRRLEHEGQPGAVVRRDFVRRLLSTSAVDPTADSVAAHPLPRTPAEALARAWDGLSVSERTAYVLGERDHLPPDVVADAMGMPAGTVRDLADAAARRLAEAYAGWSGSESNPLALQQDLGHLLEERQWSGADWGDPQALVRGGRGRRRLVAGLALVAVAVAVGGVWSTRVPEPEGTSAGTTRASTPFPSGSPELIGVGTWPARGALALDPRTAAAVRQRFGEDQRVLWAADVDGQRYVWVIGRGGTNGEPTMGHLLVGPAGTDVSALEDRPVWSDPGPFGVVSLTTGFEGTSPRHLIVLGAPGVNAAEVSRTVTIAADLTIERHWEPVSLTSGAVVLPLPPLLPALSLRSVDKTQVGQAQLNLPYTPPPDAPCADCPGPPEITGRLGATRLSVAAATGLAPADISVEVRFAGDLGVVPATADAGTPGEPPRYGYVAAFRLPSGATVQTVELLGPALDGSSGEQWRPVMVEEPLAATDVDAPIVLSIFSTTGLEQHFFLIVPNASVAEVSIASASNDPAPRVAVTQGVAVVTAPMSTMDGGPPIVHAYDASGALVSARPMFGSSPWWGPYDSYRPTLPEGALPGIP